MDTLLYFKAVWFFFRNSMGEFCLLVLSDEATYILRVVGTMFLIFYGMMWLANKAGGMQG